MCIIAYYAPGILPNREHLIEGCRSNPHGFGWGIVTFDPECPIIVGHTMDAKAAVDEFMRLRELYPHQAAVFHARITTHGTTSVDNCHPFKIDGRDDLILAHNGMVPCDPGKGDDRSDTRVLAEDLMIHRFRHLDSKKTRKRFESWMGHSKVVVLTTDPFYRAQAYIFNEHLGHWTEEGIWYSNESYKPYVYGRGRAATTYEWEYEIDDNDWYKKYQDAYPSTTRARWQDDADGWPVTVGTVRGAGEFVYLHKGPNDVGCGQEQDKCPCSAPKWFTPVDLATQGDKLEHWKCIGCKHYGTVDEETLICDMCGTCYACDRDGDNCRCAPLEGSAFAPLREGSPEMNEEINALFSREGFKTALDEVRATLALPAGPGSDV